MNTWLTAAAAALALSAGCTKKPVACTCILGAVKKGMTEADVVKAVGKPHDVRSSFGRRGSVRLLSYYCDGGPEYVAVALVAGRVDTVTNMGEGWDDAPPSSIPIPPP